MLSQGGSWVSGLPDALLLLLHVLAKGLCICFSSAWAGFLRHSLLPSPCRGVSPRSRLPYDPIHPAVTLITVTRPCFICSHSIYHCPALQHTLTFSSLPTAHPPQQNVSPMGAWTAVCFHTAARVSLMEGVVGRTASHRCPHPWNLGIGYVAKN